MRLFDPSQRIELTLDLLSIIMPYRHAGNSPAYQIPESAINNTGLMPTPIHYNGGNNANIFNQKRLPTFNNALGAEKLPSADELILIEVLIKSVDIALGIVKFY